MSGFTYATLTAAISSYTEVDTNVLTSTITNQIIDNAEMRILLKEYKFTLQHLLLQELILG